mmetsp:Transcript_74065/g.128506  ORF Transcript_74065/g.128506 Transcript_74065/m.128506 type:complete len:216 (+) Transcript_74065:114-761(+)
MVQLCDIECGEARSKEEALPTKSANLLPYPPGLYDMTTSLKALGGQGDLLTTDDLETYLPTCSLLLEQNAVGDACCKGQGAPDILLGFEYQNSSQADLMPTTLMMCNIPCRLNLGALIDLIDSHGFAGTYDFLHLPCRGRNRSNLGYAFINFLISDFATQFSSKFDGVPFSTLFAVNTEKTIEIRPARLQGFTNNITALSRRRKKSEGLEHRLII